MNYLIKNATVYDKTSKWHLKKLDILISRGTIEKIATSIKNDEAKLVEGKDLGISPGWMDIGTTLREPGFEDLDDIGTLCTSANAGGFTALAVFPNTNPVIDNKGAVETILFRSSNQLTDLFPIGSLTVGNKGTDIAEMTDMHAAGALAFSDGEYSIQHAGVLKRALRYVSDMGTTIINHPNDRTLSETGIMNESGESAFMGLKGIPSLAEEIMLNRDIQLCAYSESRLLSHMISTRESVKLVKRAKQAGNKVYASVSFHNLVETDKRLRDFDPMHKVLPPLRSQSDVNALIKGLNDDTIDCIVSNHIPVDVEEKKKAFFFSAYGSLGLEQLFAVLWSRLSSKLSLEVLLDKLSHGPRKVLGIPTNKIGEGEPANLTVFDLEEEWTFTESHIKSKSQNAAFLGEELKGKILGVINGRKSFFQ